MLFNLTDISAGGSSMGPGDPKIESFVSLTVCRLLVV